MTKIKQKESGNSERSSARSTDNTESSKGRHGHLLVRIIFLLLIIFLTFLLALGIWARGVFGPMDLSTATASQMETWLMLRKFEPESPEVRRALLLKYLEFYGPNIKNSTKSSTPGMIRNLSRRHIQNRYEEILKWDATRPKANYFRQEYEVDRTRWNQLQASDNRSDKSKESVSILPIDIRATSALKEDLSLNQGGRALEASVRMEQNIRYLVREWFLWKMDEYAKVPTNEQKKDFLYTTAKEMDWWQRFYIDSLVRLDLPELKILELYREFNMTILWWHDIADNPDDLARLLWFKDLLVSFLVAEQTGQTPQIPVFQTTTSSFKPVEWIKNLLKKNVRTDATKFAIPKPVVKETKPGTQADKPIGNSKDMNGTNKVKVQ